MRPNVNFPPHFPHGTGIMFENRSSSWPETSGTLSITSTEEGIKITYVTSELPKRFTSTRYFQIVVSASGGELIKHILTTYDQSQIITGVTGVKVEIEHLPVEIPVLRDVYEKIFIKGQGAFDIIRDVDEVTKMVAEKYAIECIDRKINELREEGIEVDEKVRRSLIELYKYIFTVTVKTLDERIRKYVESD